LASQTISTAQEAGWIWDIGLPTRRGVGYVYSSRHTSEEAARETLLRYIGERHRELPVRKIPIRSGHRETFWKNNCIAVGLAAGFLEPLESSAIVLGELSAKYIADQLPACREVMDLIAKRFNEVTHYRWGRIIDFLKLHYVLTQRTDSAFWRDNVDPAGVPERLKELLTLWKYQSPWFFDEFDRLEEVFPAASYQYVLYGMGFRTEVAPVDTADTTALASRLVTQNERMIGEMRTRLPKNRELLNKIFEYGLQPV
jgi:tryptophan 7-halogenase